MTAAQLADKILPLLQPKCGQDIVVDAASSPITITVPAVDLAEVLRTLHTSPDTYMDMLSCITGLDNGPAAGTFEVLYHLYSVPYHHSLVVKIILPHAQPQVVSVTDIWGGANWLEREIFDLYGVVFLQHPDLRRILMPADWEGHPLRKDYVEQERYHGIQVKSATPPTA